MKELAHPLFGDLTWDEEFGDWVGSIVIDARMVELRLLTNGVADIPVGFERMFASFAPSLATLLTDAAHWVISELSHWLEEKEDKSFETIVSQMRIAKVEIYSESGATVWFDGPTTIYDSGHIVEGRIGEDGRFCYFCLSG